MSPRILQETRESKRKLDSQRWNDTIRKASNERDTLRQRLDYLQKFQQATSSFDQN